MIMTQNSMQAGDAINAAQQLDAMVRQRRSVRGFLPTEVPEDTLTAIFETASWAPSGTNVQPWHVCVASGATCDMLREGFLARFDAGEKVSLCEPSQAESKSLYWP